MTTQIIPSNGNKLAAFGDQAVIHQLAARIKLMVYNGKHLNDEEALALAQYAHVNDLNPTIGECYYLPGVGPGPGIAGWRKKADEQLAFEAQNAAEPLARFWTEYSEPAEEEVGKLNPGDLAVKSILHDTLTKGQWEKRILSAYIECVKGGIQSREAMTVAQEIVGSEPTWSAVGIVRAGENFGGDKMPRYERACKRADKAAIRKRFPRVSLPEPAGFDEAMIVDEVPKVIVQQERPSQAQLMYELGFGEKSAQIDEITDALQQAEVAYAITLEDAMVMPTKSGGIFSELSDEKITWLIEHNTPESKAHRAAQVIWAARLKARKELT